MTSPYTVYNSTSLFHRDGDQVKRYICIALWLIMAASTVVVLCMIGTAVTVHTKPKIVKIETVTCDKESITAYVLEMIVDTGLGFNSTEYTTYKEIQSKYRENGDFDRWIKSMRKLEKLVIMGNEEVDQEYHSF